jgi:hypothetical protein
MNIEANRKSTMSKWIIYSNSLKNSNLKLVFGLANAFFHWQAKPNPRGEGALTDATATCSHPHLATSEERHPRCLVSDVTVMALAAVQMNRRVPLANAKGGASWCLDIAHFSLKKRTY